MMVYQRGMTVYCWLDGLLIANAGLLMVNDGLLLPSALSIVHDDLLIANVGLLMAIDG